MSVTPLVSELTKIDEEIRKIRASIKPTLDKLNKRKKDLEEQILIIMQKTGDPGIKFKEVSLIPEEKTVFHYKGKKQKLSDTKNVLEESGVQNANETLEKVLNAMKGTPEKKLKLKIQRKKK